MHLGSLFYVVDYDIPFHNVVPHDGPFHGRVGELARGSPVLLLESGDKQTSYVHVLTRFGPGFVLKHVLQESVPVIRPMYGCE